MTKLCARMAPKEDSLMISHAVIITIIDRKTDVAKDKADVYKCKALEKVQSDEI